MAKVVIPYTPILALHHRMAPRAGSGERRSIAKQEATAKTWADDPSELIDAYLESVELFQTYSNPAEHFLNLRPDGTPDRVPLPDPPPLPILGTDPLVSWIKQQGGFEIEAHAELDLGVDYVEREVSVIRTLDAEWDDPKAQGSAGRALQADLLLRTHNGKPAIGEIKVTSPGKPTKAGPLGQPKPDKDPLAALVQAVAAVAHLATENQFKRLGNYFSEFEQLDANSPRLDVYLVEYNHGGIWWMEEMLENVKSISHALTGQPEVSKTLRRIVFVELFVVDGRLQSQLHWVA